MYLSPGFIFIHEFPHGSWCVLLAATTIANSTTRTSGFQGHCVSLICQGTLPGLASWWHPHQSLSSPLIWTLPPFPSCSYITTCQILVIIVLWGPFWIRASLQVKPYGIEFSSCEPKPFSDYSFPNAASCPHEKNKTKQNIVSKDIQTSSSYCQRIYCWWFKCKGTRNIWITFPFKWAWSSKWREWINYLAISSLEVVSIKVFER